MRGLAFVLALTLAACSTQLERGLSEESADEIIVALSEHGIGATKEADRGATGFGVRVLESDVAAALSVLREEGLPRVHGASVAEAFAEPSLIPTAGEERARLAAALSADLERTIESMDGVHDAHVHLGLPDPSVVPLDEQPEPRVASVLVRSEAGATVSESDVRALVAGAVPGLSADHVSVVMTARTAEPPTSRLVQYGPVAVSEGSAGSFKALVATLLAVIAVLAAGLLFALRRRAR
jgi:type III secretion protein J